LPTPPARLPYVPHVPPMALLGKVTATTFALERPRCVFDGHADASDAVWLAVAFANGEHSLVQHVPLWQGTWGTLTLHLCRAASAAFRNPQSRADVPPYKQLPTARSYMTLETAAAAYSCSAPSPPVLRVGSDTACRDQGRQDPCNGPLPSPGPYRVKFLLMGCRGPKAETRWSEPILLRTAVSPSTIEPVPARRGSAVVVIASILASLGAVLATTVLGALGAKVWGSLCHQGLGTHAFIRRSYRTHHIPPALPQPLPPGCGCSPPGLCCPAPQSPAPCQ
ncbi:UPK3B protein, partial [Vidua chalybeata]|nr:UPK3B protein [Vidua chalybeata]